MIPLRQYSTYSIGKALGQPDELIDKAKENEFGACAITEKGNVFSAVKFLKAAKKASIKPIFGIDFNVKSGDKTFNLLCHAKNLEGWQGILQAVSESSLPENDFNDKHTISLERLSELFKKNVLVCLGHVSSELGTSLFEYKPLVYNTTTYDDCKSLVNKDWEKITENLYAKYMDMFGKDNVFGEICLSERLYIPASDILGKIVRYMMPKFGLKVIPTTNAHYANKEDAEIHRILLCSSIKSTLMSFPKDAEKQQQFDILPFFRTSSAYYLNRKELAQIYSMEEVQNTYYYSSLIEELNFLSKPLLPSYDCPNGMSAPDYLRHLCREGWTRKIANQIPKEEHQKYGDRVKMELAVIDKAGLTDYFLIVQDIVNWAKRSMLVGPGRGSAGGCMVAYLINVTDINPIEYNLSFERFYNEGRNTPTKISLPDIDSDFPIKRREDIYKYIEEKYGKDRVSHITTFGRLRGKMAIKEVLRVKNRCSFAEMNDITKSIPDESKISGDLEEMEKEDEDGASIIKWSLENVPKLKEWCKIGEGNKFEGTFGKDFHDAIRLEGSIKSHGKHAAGVIIGKFPLVKNCPLLYDKHGQKAGFAMGDLEDIGHVKMDILGVKAIDDLMATQKYVREGLN